MEPILLDIDNVNKGIEREAREEQIIDPLKLTVAKLRIELKKRGLPSKGLKSALQSRLAESLYTSVSSPSDLVTEDIVPETATESSNDTPDPKPTSSLITLTNNDMTIILQIIEIIQYRGKISVNDMVVTGQRYQRLHSYLEFRKLSEDEQHQLIQDEKDSENPTYIKLIEIVDVVFYFNFLYAHKKQGNFKKEEDEIIGSIYNKIFNTLKPFIKENESNAPSTDTPLESISEETDKVSEDAEKIVNV